MESITGGQIGLAVGIVSLVGVAFAVYKSYRNPQVEADKKAIALEAVVDQKAALLEERAKWDREQSALKFKETDDNAKQAFALAQNHIHSVDVKVDNVAVGLGELKGEVIKIATILEERLPKKKE